MVGYLFLQAEDAQGGAALAGAVECGGQDVDHHLLGERRRVDDHRVHPASFGDQRRRASLSVEAAGDIALQQGGHFGGAGEHHAAHALIGCQRGADGFPAARQQLDHPWRHAGFQQDRHALGGDQRRLLGRFRQHAVAGRQRGGNLPGEDRQREVPRADTDHRTQRTVGFIIEIVAHLAGIVVEEVNGFAHFGDGVAEGFTRFAHQDPHQGRHLAFHQHRGTLENGGALLRRGGEPDWRVVDSAGQRLLHFVIAGFADVADNVLWLSRVDYRLHLAFGYRLLQHRQCLPFMQGAVEQGRGEGGQTMLVSQIQTGGVAPAAAVEIARQRDFRMRQAGLAFLLRQFFYRADRVGHQLVQRQGIVRDTVDEGGIGAVLQQTTHQIRQQRLVGAHRGVDPAWPVQFAVGDFAHHLLVQRFAHAVQALELILARVVVLARQLVDSRQGMGVVGGELRVNQVRHRQQLFSAGEIGDVGVNLAGVDRIAFETFHLRAFDFAVPVGAFHQTDHQATAAAGGEVNQVINDKRTALLVGLNHEANPVPARQLRLEAQFFQQVERDLQTVRFFGVDVNADVILARQQGQRFQTRVELFHHPVILGAAVAWVQSRQLNGDARPFINAAAVRGFADGVDRLLIRDHIGLGVGGGQGRFA